MATGPERTSNGVLSDVAKKVVERKPRTASKPQPSSASSGNRFDLDQSQNVDSTTAAISTWTVFDASAYLPSEARYAVIQCYGRNISAPVGARTFQCRREAGAIERTVIYLRGTTTSDITAMVAEASIELTGAKTFEYMADAMSERSVDLIGYLV